MDSILEIGWFFRIDKDESNFSISTMRSNLMELFTDPFSPKLYFDALNQARPQTAQSNRSNNNDNQTAPGAAGVVGGYNLNNNEFIAQQAYHNGLFRTKLRELLVDHRVPGMEAHPFGYNINEAFTQQPEIVSLFIPKNMSVKHYMEALEYFRMIIKHQQDQWRFQQHQNNNNHNENTNTAAAPPRFVFQYPNKDEKKYLKNNLLIEFKKDGRIILPGSLIIYPGCNPYDLYQEFLTLNHEQKLILQKALFIKDYLLLWGLPGTGKTTLLSLIIRIIIARNETILLTSYTHNAINHLLEKLLLKGCSVDHLLRIGNTSQYLSNQFSSTNNPLEESINPIHSKILQCTLETSSHLTTISQLSERIATTRIYLTTILNASKNKILKTLKCNYCIIDEAGQITEPLTIGGLLHSEKFILVGDDYQLSPLVLNKESASLGMNVSLLKRLMNSCPSMACSLTIQYRMNEAIMSLCNELIYGKTMSCGTPMIAKGLLKLPFLEKLLWPALNQNQSIVVPPDSTMKVSSSNRSDWLFQALLPENAVIHLNTDALLTVPSEGSVQIHSHRNPIAMTTGEKEKKKSTGRTRNPIEATLVAMILKGLEQVQPPTPPKQQHSHHQQEHQHQQESPYHVAILTPFRAQVQLLQTTMAQLSVSFSYEICTIDKYQGKDSDIVILSLVLLPDNSNNSKRKEEATTLTTASSSSAVVNVNHAINKPEVNIVPTRMMMNELDLEDVTGNILKDWRRINVALTR